MSRSMKTCAFLALLASVSASRAQTVECAMAPNGTFEQGVGGWVLAPETSFEGDAFAYYDSAVMNTLALSPDPTWDAHVLAMAVSSRAGYTGGTGQASSTLTAQLNTLAGGETLRVKLGGGFEHMFLGQTGRSVRAAVEVNSGSRRLEQVLYAAHVEPGEACGPGLFVLGTFESPQPVMVLDLASAGILPGDPIQIRVTVRTTVVTQNPCQVAETFATLLVDEVQFCGPHIPGDVNLDGVVDLGDLGVLLSNYGCVGNCPGDTDNDNDVDLADLGAVLADYTG